MLSKPTRVSLATNRDVELEWLLCLAAAHQVSQPQQEKFANQERRHYQSGFLRGVQGLSKSLRWTEPKEPRKMSYPWFALWTRSRFENIVTARLNGNDYEWFLPFHKTRRRWS